MIHKPRTLFSLFFLLVLVFSLSGCNSDAQAETPSPTPPAMEVSTQPEESEGTPKPETTPEPTPEPAWEWQFDRPENHGLSQAGVDALHTALDPTDVRAAVIVKNGVMVDEYYKSGFDETSVFTLQSCSKSFTSAIMGIAIDQGYIESVDEPISNYFPHLLDNPSPYAGEVTIWHLLTHTSGFYGTDNELWGDWRTSDNWVDYVLEQSIVTRPGSTFNYSTGNSHLLGVIVEMATGKSLYEYGKEVLFDPLGMESVECGLDPQGHCDGGNGFAMNVYDMAKFGQLFLQKGKWEGEQILSENWVEGSTSLQFKRSTGTADYGYQWWVRTFGDQQYPAFFAQGHFGQYIFVVPDLELVVVFTSYHNGSSSMYWQFVSDIVAACNDPSTTPASGPIPPEQTATPESVSTPSNDSDTASESNRILVAYFSRTGENYSVGVIDKGNTAIVAELIAEQTGGELFEIVPVEPYPSDYEEMKTLAMEEKNQGTRPAIADTVENWEDYNVVFLGYPIWHADMPMIVYNFLESYDFTGKTVIPFNTHEGSGQSGTQSRIAAAIPGATVLNGLAIRGDTAQNNTSSAQSTVEKWITEDLNDVLLPSSG